VFLFPPGQGIYFISTFSRLGLRPHLVFYLVGTGDKVTGAWR